MNRQIGYQCPKDVLKMPKVGDNYSCNLCKKDVINLTNHSDIGVIRKIQKTGSSSCIHIQKDRLSLVTEKFPKWRIFILLVINFKVFLIQKFYAQNNDSSFSNKSQQKNIIKKLKGNINDSETGMPVRKPLIELYRGDIKIQTLKGDREGKFILSVESSSSYADTVSIVISCKNYDSKKVFNLPLYKKTTSLKTSIDKKKSRNKKKNSIGETFTGDVYLD